MSYHQLLRLSPNSGLWVADFGDTSCAVVQAEHRDYRDHGIPAKHLKIVRFERVPTQAQLAARLAEINA